MKIVFAAAVAAAFVSTTPTVAVAGPAEQAVIGQYCLTNRLSQGACQCWVEQSKALTENQQAFVAATFAADQNRVTQLITAMSGAEITGVTAYMQSVGVTCGR